MPSDDTRPNVLLLLTDQERYDLTAEGGVPVETPALDGLRDDGVHFERAYTPISICSSARASMLTGLYPHNHGLLNNVHGADAIREDLDPDLPTFSERLDEAGYDNTHAGKWHVGRTQGPDDFGMRHLGGSDVHHDTALPSEFGDYRRDLGVDADVDLSETIRADYGDDGLLVAGRTPVPPEATRAYYLAERTIERLEAAADGDDPFFHRTDFLGPHHPYVVPDPYASMYDPADLDPWPSFAETFDGKPRVQENYLRYRGVADFGWDVFAEALAKYMGFMTLIDEQIGRILAAVDDLGLTDETLVVHASDHGDFAGAHRQFNKGPMMYEDTYRVPLAARGPGVDGSGRRCEAVVSLVDLAPTLIETAGEPVPEGLDGHSFRPLLEDADADPTRDAAFAEYHGDEFGLYSQRMVRRGRYKLVYNPPDVDELYDLEADPAELNNLVDHPEYRGVRRDLVEELIAHLERTDDPIAPWTRKHLRDQA